MRVFLIGLPGVGKSRTAKELSLLMNIPFVDLDKLIEKKAGITISEIFSNYGEDYFRELETNTLKEYSMVDNIIVSCGGGIIKRSINKEYLRSGITFYLSASLELIKTHILNKEDKRPLLKTKTIEEIYNERIDLYYDFMNFMVDYETSDKAANKIMEYLKNPFKKNVLVINGPNINLLGLRDKNHYGALTMDKINEMIEHDNSFDFEFFQSNHEGAIVDKLQEYKKYAGIIINPAAYTHTSIAIHDCLEVVDSVKVEVHLSEVDMREDFRKVNYVRDVCDKCFAGKKEVSYLNAVNYLKTKINVL